jgi:hypothetical protein
MISLHNNPDEERFQIVVKGDVRKLPVHSCERRSKPRDRPAVLISSKRVSGGRFILNMARR